MKDNTSAMIVVYTAYAVMWIAVSAAVFGAVYITHSATCLWALIIPSFISLKYNKGDEKEKV